MIVRYWFFVFFYCFSFSFPIFIYRRRIPLSRSLGTHLSFEFCQFNRTCLNVKCYIRKLRYAITFYFCSFFSPSIVYHHHFICYSISITLLWMDGWMDEWMKFLSGCSTVFIRCECEIFIFISFFFFFINSFVFIYTDIYCTFFIRTLDFIFIIYLPLLLCLHSISIAMNLWP